MKKIKQISQAISNNMTHNTYLQYVRTSLTRLTTVMIMTMTVLAQSLIAEAQAAEPEITRDVRALEQHGAYLAGLDHRIKAEESLVHKILANAVNDNVNLVQAANDISDVLRYTLVIKDEDYSRQVPEAMEKNEQVRLQKWLNAEAELPVNFIMKITP